MSDFVVKALINNVEKSADVVANLEPKATFDGVDYYYKIEISGLSRNKIYYLDDYYKASISYEYSIDGWQCAYGTGQYHSRLTFVINAEHQGVVELDKSNICNLENAYIAVENENLVLYYNTIYKNTNPVNHAELSEIKAGIKVATVEFSVSTSDVRGWKVVNGSIRNESGKAFSANKPALIKASTKDSVSALPCVLFAGLNEDGDGRLFMIYIDTVPQENKTFSFDIYQ